MVTHHTNRADKAVFAAAAARIPRCRPLRRHRRRGFILVVVLTILTISLALFGVWTKAAIYENRRIGNYELRAQAVRLAEAGLRRAALRRQADSVYQSETWSIPAADLDGRNAGQVQIRIQPDPKEAALRIEAIATFPIEGERRAQVTRSIQLTNYSAPRDES
jgi:hypothetical protein